MVRSQKLTKISHTCCSPHLHQTIMPKHYCDYCDVFLTHDSASVRKAHNSGRNHLANVKDYYASLGHDKAQSIIDQITSAYESSGGPPPGGFGFGPQHLGAPPPQFPPMGFGGPPPFGGRTWSSVIINSYLAHCFPSPASFPSWWFRIPNASRRRTPISSQRLYASAGYGRNASSRVRRYVIHYDFVQATDSCF
ncbi:hypothetical protein GYMLUDRAFT_801268 [Collybiopsis luxurians FD-317 M1]|nr:hypothetical protein GYMLUDRAFT_801268 [Collybiopsis luxurians FD-317 M1]